MNKLYHIVFEDNTTISAGSIEEPKWLDIPNKKIRSIFYSLPTGDMICLSGFKRIYCQKVKQELSCKAGSEWQ